MPALNAFIQWATANPSYGLGILLGLALGIFYGFDGWRGSTEEIELKDSPRAKNFLWILTGALTTIVGDVHSFDESAKKPVLLLSYCAAVLVGASLVVLIWGLIVAIDSLVSQRNLGHDYSALDALGDYFFFGYRKFRERKLSIAQTRAFQQEYLEQLANSIAAAGSNAGDAQRLEFVRNILRSMAAVVLKYRGANNPGGIRANLMLAQPCDGERMAQLRFLADGKTVQYCLELVAYHNEEARDTVLPIPDDRKTESALPGAPTAFVGNVPVVVDDTNQIEFPTNLTPSQIASMRNYLKAKRAVFKSFASLCIVGRGRVLGVVNVDCSEEYVFGHTEAEKTEVIRYLLPFCTALGILLARV